MDRPGRAAAILGAALIAALGAAAPAGAATAQAAAVRLERAGTFTFPSFVASPPGDSRLYVLEQGSQSKPARIVVAGSGRRQTFLDLSARVDAGGELGLLSMAFAPDYARSGRFYVYYSTHGFPSEGIANDAIQIDEFRRAPGDGWSANPASRRPVLTIPHPPDPHHYGGQLQFGPDGLLYVSTGDGGGENDENRNSQNPATLLGKLLRIDPRAAPGSRYRIPRGNPYAGRPGVRPEILAFGLRNPWRMSFDHATGDLVIADVGQGGPEEVEFVPRGAAAGLNFGWARYEGPLRNFQSADAALTSVAPVHTPPTFTYTHAGGRCAIMGGFVSRSRRLPALRGRYLYADLCTGTIRSVRLARGSARGDAWSGTTVPGPVSFGQTGACDLYVVSQATGGVYRLRQRGVARAAGCLGR